MILHRMTWPEAAGIDWERTLVLLPTGATEQHGPHLPVDTDTLIATRLAEAVEEALPERIVLTPTVWLGHSPHHLSFGGTLSLYHNPYIEMIAGICRSYIGMGARKIWILNGHGGNHMPLSVVLQQLKNEHKDAVITTAEYWSLAREEMAAIRESGPGGMGHACEMETSMYMYLQGDRVRRDLIRDDGVQPEGQAFQVDMLKGGAASRAFNFDELTESGVFGQPTLATEAKGKQFYEAIAARLIGFANELLQLEGKGRE